LETEKVNYGLEGKTALVTGGTHGIGAAIVDSLANQGVSVAFLSRSEEKLDATDQKIRALGVKTLPIKCDVLDHTQVENSWKVINNSWGGVDILVNNVGGGGRWGTENIVDTPFSTWGEVFQKNAGVASRLSVLALPNMLDKKWGRIITVTSIYGTLIGGRPWFNMAKFAQTVLMKNLAQNPTYARAGITFNSVAPGAVMIPDTGWTEMEKTSPDQFNAFIQALPLGRMGNPQEVANLVTFISSKYSSYLNGASIVLDGGESCGLN
jgi:3-oxoacyl-[acyl-carrier protein] reductase